MALVDRVQGDIARVLMNQGQFATVHTWNSQQITCVVDNDSMQKRKVGGLKDISYDMNSGERLIFVPMDQLDKEPCPEESVLFDGSLWNVVACVPDMGLYEVHLSSKIGRELY